MPASVGSLDKPKPMIKRNGMKLAVCLISLVLVACGGTSRISTPEGGSGYRVKCKTDRGACLAEAGEVCNGPYYVINEDQHSGGIFGDLLPGPVTWWSITVGCGRAPYGYTGSSRSYAPRTENPFETMGNSLQEGARAGAGKRCHEDGDCETGYICHRAYGTYKAICVPG